MPRKATTKTQPVDTTDPFYLPPFLLLTPEQRRKAWERNPPVSAVFVPVVNPVYSELRKEEKKQKLETLRARTKARKASPDRIAARLAAGERNRGVLSAATYERIRRELPTASMKKLLASMFRQDGKLYYPTSPALQRQSEPKAQSVERSKLRHGASDGLAEQLKDYTKLSAGGVDLQKLRKLAEANGVWSDDYKKLQSGLARMTIGNRLRSLTKKGYVIKWP